MGIVCCSESNKATPKTIITETQAKHPASREPSKKEETPVRALHPKRGPQNYQSIRYLGHGVFGKVVLAEDKASQKQYAMKVIGKDKIKEFNLLQSKLIQDMHEKNFLVEIKETFQNQNYIYIIMEYLPKGDIYFYLKKKEVKFTEQTIMGIASEIIVAIEFLHEAGIVYRQLKPENVLVTNDGHIKITDYALSKMMIKEKEVVNTFAGTKEYTAPEALAGEYGQKADIWSIGVLMYELTFENNPFEGKQLLHNEEIERSSNLAKSPLLTEEKKFQTSVESVNMEEILNMNIGKISQNYRDLLMGLLETSPEKRLTLQQIKHHSFFATVDWEQVINRTNEGPLKQLIGNNNHIMFRDAISEKLRFNMYQNKSKVSTDVYELNLFQFRNSH